MADTTDLIHKTTYCQIVGQSIATEVCQTMQNQDQCLGCTASSHQTQNIKEVPMGKRPGPITRNSWKKGIREKTKKLCAKCGKKEAKTKGFCSVCYWKDYEVRTRELDKLGRCLIDQEQIRKISCLQKKDPVKCEPCPSPFKGITAKRKSDQSSKPAVKPSIKSSSPMNIAGVISDLEELKVILSPCRFTQILEFAIKELKDWRRIKEVIYND